MKKILSFIGFLMLSSILLSPQVTLTAFGQNSTSSGPLEEKCNSGSSYSDSQKCIPFSTSRIFSKLNGAISGGKDWTDVFGTDDPSKAGQNMYTKIYDSTINQPQITAVKNITGKYGTTEGEMTQILYGDFGPILKRKPNLTQIDAINKMAEIQNRFQEEKDLLQLKAEVNAAVQPSEIFANNDLSDSGFDLINDLNIIEKILFLKADPIDIGGNFAASENNDTATTGTGNNSNSVNDKSKNNPATGTETTKNNPSAVAPNILGNAAQTALNKPVPTATAGINPNECVVPNNLDQALAKFENNKTKDSHYKDQSSPESNPKNEATPTAASGASTSTTSDPLPIIEEPPLTVQSAPADNWLKTPPCNDVFCLSINFVQKSPSVYKVSDNCIACHVEKINEKLKETIDHNLIPGKLTGNLLEPNICKKASADALSAVGLNFYAISKPVMTPQNDDLIYGVGIEDEWKKYLNTYKPFSSTTKTAPAYNITSPDFSSLNDLERATSAAVATASPNTTFQEISKNIQSQVETDAKSRAEAIKVATVAVQSDADAGLYQGIQRELDQMNAYFMIYQKTLHSLHEKVAGFTGDQACTTIKEKKACN